MNQWDERKLGMDLCVSHVRGHNLPDFCFQEGEPVRKRKRA